MPDTRKIQLRSAIENSGWRIENVKFDDTIWWLDELWRLTSTWRPTGTTAYVAFMVDPQVVREDDPKRVWAITVGREPPQDKNHTGGELFSVSPRWPERLEEIVNAVSALR